MESLSVKKYLTMLCDKMSPLMVETFIEIYKEAITRSRGHRDNTLKMFKTLLEEVENWNNTIIAGHTKKYENSCSYFSNLLAAVYIAYVNMMIQPIKKKSDSTNFEISLPSNSDFVHMCINNAAKMFQKKMLYFRIQDEEERTEKLLGVCCEAIEQTMDDVVPYDKIFTTYLPTSSTFMMSEPEPEPELEEPEIEENEDVEMEPMEHPEEPQVAPEPQEMKSIPVQQNVNLFDDAPMGQQKPEQIVNAPVS